MLPRSDHYWYYFYKYHQVYPLDIGNLDTVVKLNNVSFSLIRDSYGLCILLQMLVNIFSHFVIMNSNTICKYGEPREAP